MHMDPLLPSLTGLAVIVLGLALILGRVRIPLINVYIVSGVVIGPEVLGLVSDPETVRRLGEVGLVLLLFFLGMELSLPRLVTNWRVSVLGTIAQIIVTVLAVLAVGTALEWPLPRSILLGFVVALSSTAVVAPLLVEWGDLHTPVGDDVMGVLIVQDVALAPMIIILGLMSGLEPSATGIALQVIGALALIAVVVALQRGVQFDLPFARQIASHRDLQVFASFAVCFGLAYVTALLGLSTATGAFVGGMIVAGARGTHWVAESLDPFRVLLVAFFFVSVGALLELDFLRRELGVVVVLTVVALLTNTTINAFVLRLLGRKWRNSFYGGALLSQIGEFGFVLAALGLQIGVISGYGYQTTVAVIAMTMMITPLWCRAFRRLRVPPSPPRTPVAESQYRGS